jgi:hypothetical protein
MKQALKKTIRISVIALISLSTESVERKISIDVVDIEDVKAIEAKACKKYTSIVTMGGKVEVKKILFKPRPF